jgi:hypothetical protein
LWDNNPRIFGPKNYSLSGLHQRRESMKVRYFCELYYCDDPKNPGCLKCTVTLIDDEPVKKEWYTQKFTSEMARENALTRPYHTYLLSAIDTDFNENRFGACDDVISEV